MARCICNRCWRQQWRQRGIVPYLTVVAPFSLPAEYCPLMALYRQPVHRPQGIARDNAPGVAT